MIHYAQQPAIVTRDHRPVRNVASISAPAISADELKREADRARKRHEYTQDVVGKR